MPAEQPLPRDRSRAVGRGVEHHIDHAFGVTIDLGQSTDVHAQAAGDA